MNYLISSIQLNGSVNKTLLRNMKLFAKNHDARILLYVMPGRNKDETLIPTILLDDEDIELLYLGKDGQKLNNNLKIFDHKILASMVNPLTGMNLKLHRDFSWTLPSPKIRYMSYPNTGKHPRFLATTGSLTHGNYKEWTAQGIRAGLEHQYGFSFINIKSNRLFSFVPVEAQKNGNFHYLRDEYKNGKVYDSQPEALVLGDWHTGDTCPKTRKATIAMIGELKPKRVILHDFYDGKSINPHEGDDCLSKALRFSKNLHILEDELRACLKELNFFAKKFPDVEFVVVESNHDIFLYRYLAKGMYPMDACNSIFAASLYGYVGEYMKGKGPKPTLCLAMEMIGAVAGNVRFLKEDEEYRVKGIELGYHGHRGVNGARGTSASFSNYNLKMITGHEHTPKIHPNGMVVGTSTHLKLSYTKGASSWLNAHGLLYSSGKYTLLTLIF